jgi:hypothetical protein
MFITSPQAISCDVEYNPDILELCPLCLPASRLKAASWAERISTFWKQHLISSLALGLKTLLTARNYLPLYFINILHIKNI